LLVDKRLCDGSFEHKYPDRPPLSQERNSKAAAPTTANLIRAFPKFRIGQNIRNVNGLARQYGSSRDGPPCPSRENCILTAKLLELARETIIRSQFVRLAVLPPDHGLFRIAKPCRRLDQGIEHGLDIEGRPADDLEHVGGSRLLLQRLAQFVEQARVLEGDDRLGSKVLYQLDLLFTERLDVLAINGNCTNRLIVVEHRDHN